MSTWKATYVQTDRQRDGHFFCLFCLLSHTKHEHSSKGENFFFFTHAITILSLFTYSICDEEVKIVLLLTEILKEEFNFQLATVILPLNNILYIDYISNLYIDSLIVKRRDSSPKPSSWNKIKCLKSAATSSLREYTGREIFASGILPTKRQIAFMAILTLYKLSTIFWMRPIEPPDHKKARTKISKIIVQRRKVKG